MGMNSEEFTNGYVFPVSNEGSGGGGAEFNPNGTYSGLTAGKAVADGQGNNIIATYATKVENAAKYTKPESGIPKTDLAVAVQNSLNLAASAYQKPSTGIPESDLASDVVEKLNAGGSTQDELQGYWYFNETISTEIPEGLSDSKFFVNFVCMGVTIYGDEHDFQSFHFSKTEDGTLDSLNYGKGPTSWSTAYYATPREGITVGWVNEDARFIAITSTYQESYAPVLAWLKQNAVKAPFVPSLPLPTPDKPYAIVRANSSGTGYELGANGYDISLFVPVGGIGVDFSSFPVTGTLSANILSALTASANQTSFSYIYAQTTTNNLYTFVRFFRPSSSSSQQVLYSADSDYMYIMTVNTQDGSYEIRNYPIGGATVSTELINLGTLSTAGGSLTAEQVTQIGLTTVGLTARASVDNVTRFYERTAISETTATLVSIDGTAIHVMTVDLSSNAYTLSDVALGGGA